MLLSVPELSVTYDSVYWQHIQALVTPALHAPPSLDALQLIGELLDAAAVFNPPLSPATAQAAQLAASRQIVALLRGKEQQAAHAVINNSFALTDLREHLLQSLEKLAVAQEPRSRAGLRK